MCRILISINPEFVEKILDGTKRFEFRKIECKENVDELVIYCTSPVMKVVGIASVRRVIKGEPEEIWKQTKEYAGVSKGFYDKYYTGKSKAVAFELSDVRRFDDPKELSDYGVACPPQSFVYVY